MRTNTVGDVLCRLLGCLGWLLFVVVLCLSLMIGWLAVGQLIEIEREHAHETVQDY